MSDKPLFMIVLKSDDNISNLLFPSSYLENKHLKDSKREFSEHNS